MKYYIALNGQPAGPFEPNELLAQGLTANSLVLGEGMSTWTSASQIPELAALLSGTPYTPSNIDVQLPQMPPVGQPNQLPQTPPMGDQMPLPQMPDLPPVTTPQPTTPMPGNNTPTGQPYNLPKISPNTTNQQQGAPKTWLIESIIATAACSFCCSVPLIGLIPGIIAIYMAMGVKSKYNSGDIDGAYKKSASAKKWFFITIAVGVAAALYGSFQLLKDANFSEVIKDVENGDIPFFYGIPK